MSIEKIIVLEEDEGIRNKLVNYLRRSRFDVTSTPSVPVALDYLNKDHFDMIFLDLVLRNGRGADLLKTLQTRSQKPLVVITANVVSVESTVDCMRNGAFDYLVKPFSIDQIEITLRKAAEFTQLVRVNRFLSQQTDGYEQKLLGCSQHMENLRQLIRKVAPTHATVLIQGESGTGKEVIARELHRHGPRIHAPFIKVNCAAIPENLIESEFFGHEKGAFTGALTKREGRFELANHGTILLDEISEISPGTQAKLLRVLQEREFERVGGSRTIKVDVRVIATTNRNLQQSVERHEFRQDLFFRLNVVPIYVPPLRERSEDVMVLNDKFIHCVSRRHGINVKGFTEEARRVLASHSWPGNVRELQNVVERAVILCGDDGMLGLEHLGLGNRSETTPTLKFPPTGLSLSAGHDQHDEFPSLAEIEKKHIFAALDHCEGNRTHAARLLGVSIRTLRNKLHEYNDSESADQTVTEFKGQDFIRSLAPGQCNLDRMKEI
jgi:DNA-binding NtrC family response regulator